MCRSFSITATFFSLITSTHTRSFNLTTYRIEDPSKSALVVETDPFEFTESPTLLSSLAPSISLTESPTEDPSFNPSLYPSSYPSSNPSSSPTLKTSSNPSSYPSFQPSFDPSANPSSSPTFKPSSNPSSYPTHKPSFDPSANPSSSPTFKPSFDPSSNPSSSPTFKPSFDPSSNPSPYPTSKPFSNPSSATLTNSIITYSPTLSPSTSSPTSYPTTIFLPGDKIGGQGYFNYDPNDDEFGPGQPEIIDGTLRYKNNRWPNVSESPEELSWKRFRDILSDDYDENECWWDGRQSPIDLCPNKVNVKCEEHHQIRTRPGDFRLSDDEVTFQILPSKLRLKYWRRPLGVQEPDPPHADFPHQWSGYIDVTHLDVKIPSEHTICGNRYAGEYTVYFVHPDRGQRLVISIMIDVEPNNEKNLHFQKVIDEWQAIFEKQLMDCEYTRRELKFQEAVPKTQNFSFRTIVDSEEFESLASLNSNSMILDETEEEEIKFKRKYEKVKERASRINFSSSYERVDTIDKMQKLNNKNDLYKRLWDLSTNERVTYPIADDPFEGPDDQRKTVADEDTQDFRKGTWNPFHRDIVRSIWFYGYWGSLTEPPCSDKVTWRVLDEPMYISRGQLDQLKNILFNQVDGECRRTSTHYKESVARPIQEWNRRPLWKCTRNNFLSDKDRAET